jgi:hypothetical protein
MSYDDIARRITKQEEWKAFANDELQPVAETARTLIELRDRLAPPEPGEIMVREVVDQEPRLRRFLLGGLTDEGSVPDESLASLTEQFLGVGLDDPYKWVNAEREGLTGDEYVAVTTTDTRLISLLQTVDEQLTAVLQHLDISPPVVDDQVEAVLDNPAMLADLVQQFLTGTLQVTANTSPFTFFAYTTRVVTARYFTEAYPSLHDSLHDVAGLVGLQKRFVPDLEDGDSVVDYTVWGHTEDGVLARLHRLNQAVWTTFNDEAARSTLSPFFSNVPNPQKDFTRRAEQELTAEDWSYPDYLPDCAHPDRVPTSTASSTDSPGYRRNMDLTKAFVVEDGAIPACEVITAINTSSIVHRRQDLDESVSLLRYLDEVMPGVFLGVYNFETIEHQANETPQTGVRVYHA